MGRKPLQPGEQGALTVTRVTKTPTGWLNNPQGDMWSARIRVGQHGKPAKEIRRIAATRKAAETACREAADIETILTQAGPTGDLEWQSVRNLWDTYRASPSFMDRLKPGTRKNHEIAVRHSMEDAPEWWDMPCIEAYQRANLEPLIAKHARLHGTNPARRLKAVLKAAAQYSSAQVAELAQAPLVTPKNLPSPQAGKKRDLDRTLTRTQLADLQTQLLNASPTMGKIALLIMTYTGGRISDIFNLQKSDINWETGQIKMLSVKTGKQYPVKTLPQSILEKLHEYAAKINGDQLFPREKTSRAKSVLISRPLAYLGYPWATAHTIRKSVGSIVFDEYGLRAASEWLAHSSVQITMQWYVKVDCAAPTYVASLDFNR